MGSALIWLLFAGAVQAPGLPELDARFPYAPAVTFYGEVNGNAYYSAGGVTPDSPRAALERVSRALADERFPVLEQAAGGFAFLWQWRGVSDVSREDMQRLKQVAARAAPRWIVKLEERSIPMLGQALELFDMLCALEMSPAPAYCEPVSPMAVAAVIEGVLPQPQLLVARFERRDEQTHWRLTRWPTVSLGGLLAMGDPRAAAALCRRAPLSVPGNARCSIVARFITGSITGCVVVAETDLDAEAVRRFLARDLAASGWRAEPTGEQVGGFENWRRSERSLLLSVHAKGDGAQVLYVES